MATRYWVGNSGNWSDTSHWSIESNGNGGYSVPTSIDNVIFDSNSFSTNSTVVLDVNGYCNDMDWTMIDSSVSFSNSVNYLNIYGSFLLSPLLTFNFYTEVTSRIYFYNNTSMNLHKNGSSIKIGANNGGIYFVGSGIFNLLSDFILESNPAITINNGTLNTNSYNITCNQLRTNNCTINAGSSTISTVIYSADSGTILNPGTSTFSNKSIYSTYGFNCGNLDYYNIIHWGQSSGYLSGVKSCNNLILYINSINDSNLNLASNIVINGDFIVNSSNYRTFIKSNDIGTPRSITVNGSIVASNVDFRDITITGSSAPFDASNIDGGSGDCGGNSGIIFTPPQTQYFKHTSGAVNWSDTTKWFSDQSKTIQGRIPLPQDDVYFDASSFTDTSILTVNVRRIGKSLDMSAINKSVTVTLSNSIECYGSFVLGNNITLTYVGYIVSLCGRNSTFYINTYVKKLYALQIWSANGTYINQSNLDIGSYFEPIKGTFDINDFNLSTMAVMGGRGNYGNTDNTLYCGNGIITLTQTINNGYLWLTVQNLYTENSTIILNSSNGSGNIIFGQNQPTIFNKFIVSGNHAGYYRFTDSNTYKELIINPGRKIQLSNGKTQNINKLTALGTQASPITIGSMTPGSKYTLNLTGSNQIETDYINISDANVTQPNKFYAGINSVNGGNNTNVIFDYVKLPLNMNLYTVKMYDRVLTDSEVLTNFNSTKTRYGL